MVITRFLRTSVRPCLNKEGRNPSCHLKTGFWHDEKGGTLFIVLKKDVGATRRGVPLLVMLKKDVWHDKEGSTLLITLKQVFSITRRGVPSLLH